MKYACRLFALIFQLKDFFVGAKRKTWRWASAQCRLNLRQINVTISMYSAGVCPGAAGPVKM